MTACTQRGCIGTIVDGYCDVCGSPAGAALFIPARAAASAASPAPAARTGLTAGSQASGFPPRPRNCTQRGCIGTIVDGYCDVCGSPAGAALFIPAGAAASAASPAPSARTGLTAGGPGSPPRSCRQRGCTGTIVDGYCDVCGSPAGAPPSIPAGAAAQQPNLAEEERPTQRIPRVQLPSQPSSAQEMADPAAADPGDERPTQRIPRVQVRTQQLSTNEMADHAAADHPALDAQKVDGEKALAEDQPDGAQDYRTRVEGAELPDDVREAALCEVDKLERASDQGPDSGEIRIWLDTILNLPWSAEVTDSIDIQGSREVEATLRRLIEPAAGDVEGGDTAEVEAVPGDVERGDTAEVDAMAGDVEGGDAAEVEATLRRLIEPAADDVEEGDTAEVEAVPGDVEGGDAAEVEATLRRLIEPAADDIEEGDTAEVEAVPGDAEEGDAAEVDPAIADTEKADTAPAGPHDDDTVETPAVLAGLSGRRHPGPQLPEQRVVAPVPVQDPADKKRFGSLALAATALAAVLIGALFFANQDVGGVTARSDATVTATATMPVSKPPNERSDESTDTGRGESTIQLEDLAASARPFEAVRIQGTYRGGAGTFVRVQRWEGGRWLDFPLPTKTDQSGQFITQAEFGQPGRYSLRVLDPDSGVASETFVVVIKD
jgi:hypothetical protein